MEHPIHVVAGIIYNSEYKKILIARKKSIFIFGGLWEFPGGKVEEYESYEMALKRELKEELNIEINSIQSYLSELYNSNGIFIHLNSFQCRYQSGEITLKDHDQVKWVEKSELSSYNFSPADIHIVKNISSCL